MLPVCSQLQMRRPFSTPLTHKTMRILLIEDNPGLRKIYLLALDDYEVTSATTAAEAKFMLGRQQFDIVLSDFNLTDGTSAKVFEQFPCPAPHVLLMTGASDDPQFRQMISAQSQIEVRPTARCFVGCSHIQPFDGCPHLRKPMPIPKGCL